MLSLLGFLYDKKSIENRDIILFDTGSPPSVFGLDGYNIFENQSVSVSFLANAEGTLKTLNLWVMSDNPNSKIDVIFVKSLPNTITDKHVILERFENININTKGFNPTMISLNSIVNLQIEPSDNYWIIVKSSNKILESAVWCQTNSRAFTSFLIDGVWEDGSYVTSPGVQVIIEGAKIE